MCTCLVCDARLRFCSSNRSTVCPPRLVLVCICVQGREPYIGVILQGRSRLCLGSVFGFRMDNPSVLCVYGMITVRRKGPLPAPYTFCCSFGRTAKSTVWPIRHWGGEPYANPYSSIYLYARMDVWEKLTKKRKQHPPQGDDTSTVYAATCRVGRREQGEARPAISAPRGGLHLDLL